MWHLLVLVYSLLRYTVPMDPLGILLIPVMYFFLVRPLAWLLYRKMPDGRLKTFLFRTRGPIADWSRGHTLYPKYSWRWWISW